MLKASEHIRCDLLPSSSPGKSPDYRAILRSLLLSFGRDLKNRDVSVWKSVGGGVLPGSNGVSKA